MLYPAELRARLAVRLVAFSRGHFKAVSNSKSSTKIRHISPSTAGQVSGIQYAAASRLHHLTSLEYWVIRSSRTMTAEDVVTRIPQTQFLVPAARCARSFANRFAPRKSEGAGNAGCALHPRSHVQYCAKMAHMSIQVQRKHSGIPRAMALRLMARSPRRRIPFVTVVDELAALAEPGRARKASANLTPATGARTTRFCRTLQRRSSACRRSLTSKPPCDHVSRPTLPRPPHPVPTFVTWPTPL